MKEQGTLPLMGGWEYWAEKGAPTAVRKFHANSLAPRELDEGGCFDYSATPGIFLGRSGLGPLRVAWDTNVLIDWRDFGRLLQPDEELALPVLEADHDEDVVALDAVMNSIWMVRDIRVYPLRRQMSDFGRARGRPRDGRLAAERARQLDEIASALWCVGLSGEFKKSGRSRANDWRAPTMRPSADRTLVEDAIVRGCHVFLTRDKNIIRHGQQLAALGIAAMRPTELLDTLAASGELGRPGGADGMICDNHKWKHLEAATGIGEVSGAAREGA